MGKRAKISVIGAGRVGEHVALFCAIKELGDVVLYDIVENMPQGKALDLYQTMPLGGWDSKIYGTNSYEDIKDSDIVVITAGFPRKPGMSRDDLLKANADIVKVAAENVAKYAPNSFIIVVTNPLDAMTQLAWHVSGFPKNRVMGQAGNLDSARFCAFISMELNVSVRDVQALVLGGHGDDMVPLPKYTVVNGVTVDQLIPPDRLQALIERTRFGGGEIVKLLGYSAYYAPALATVKMVEAILKDQKSLQACAAYCEGEYGINGVYCGVPCILGANGVEKIVEIQLTKEELEALQASAGRVKGLVDQLREFGYIK